MVLSRGRPIRIAGASGAASDRRHALANFASQHPHDPVDVIINDYLSEANMATSAGEKHGNASAISSKGPVRGGFEPSVLEALKPAFQPLSDHGIKVVINAGANDTEALYHVICELISSQGLDIAVAWIAGDDVLEAVNVNLRAGKSDFKNIHTGAILSDWNFTPIAAQAYLGGIGIAEALAHGAQIVVCGRVADASPVIGAALWWHGWQRGDFDKLANALVAGHLIECSTYVTGGNFSGFKSLEHTTGGWTDMGFPIAEISYDGKVVITKQKDSGGTVSVDTCSSQLLYEIQGPLYFNSDVTAALQSIWFEQVGADRVAVHGVKGLPPPSTTKVGITAFGGFQAEAYYFLTGLDVEEKARMLETQIRRQLQPYSDRFTILTFSKVGTPGRDAKTQNAATIPFRIFAQAPRAECLAPRCFLRPVMDNIMQSYPGATPHLDVRQGIPKQYYEYYVTLMPQTEVEHVVHLANGRRAIEAPSITREYPERQASQDTTATPTALTKFGPTQRLPLGSIVHARSGDKGSDANCGFWVRHADEYAWLRSMLSVARIKLLLGEEYDESRRPKIHVERFELPDLKGVHFLFRNLLDRGVSSTSTLDFLGKNVAEFLRQRHVDIPVRFLARGKL